MKLLRSTSALSRIASRYWTPRYRPGPRVLFDGDTVTAVILSNPDRLSRKGYWGLEFGTKRAKVHAPA